LQSSTPIERIYIDNIGVGGWLKKWTNQYTIKHPRHSELVKIKNDQLDVQRFITCNKSILAGMKVFDRSQEIWIGSYGSMDPLPSVIPENLNDIKAVVNR